MPYVPTILAALVAAVSGLLFTLTFTAWLLCEPAARSGPFRPRPWLFLAAFTLFCSLAYFLAP